MTKWVYDLGEGNKDMGALLGGKGANLAEMTSLGLPVPPGFTITTQACREFLRTGAMPTGLIGEVAEHLRTLEERTGRRLGDAADPLLVSVRSGAKFSMPGMMDTILNVGLTAASTAALARQGGEAFARDCYRRLNDMFATTVGQALPADPHQQLDRSIEAVFESWNSPRARAYRRHERIPDDLGTAVNVVAMVFGNLGPDSGTGVAFTRDPATGSKGSYGDYLPNAQGEDVVAGHADTVPLQELERLDQHSFAELTRIMSILESHYRDLCDIEFTIERGKLWMLQTRVGKRTAAAAFVIATQLAEEGLIDEDEALRRVTGSQLAQLMFPAFDLDGREPVTTGVAASPGAAVGQVVFDSHRAAEIAHERGQRVILVRRETNPDDLPGMIAAQGILTSHGGKTSHAAVVARGLGRACVCGADGVEIDLATRSFTVGSAVVKEGDVISIDGSTGAVYLDELPVRPSTVVRFLEGDHREHSPLLAAVERLMDQADRRRRLGVRANADTPADAQRARRLGAAGIGLCRTEHMFLGERRHLVERLILDDRRQGALDELLQLQREDFIGILRAMDGLPVTVRLIDPPLHEFLPPLEELTARVATAQARGQDPGHDGVLLAAVRRLHEQNPMLGLRGVRLGLVVPGLFEMQVRAVAQAADHLRRDGHDPRPEIMVPLVGSVTELAAVRDLVRTVAGDIPVGTMIEVPRAALTAGEIAPLAEFFSFGTNDLTQLGWGFSRDDVEGSFFSRYLELGIFDVSPFESLDVTGIGRLVRIAVDEGRAARPTLTVGVCGEHGGDPDSIHFFEQVGLDYVSCSPLRVPVARLEAGRAALAT